MVVREERIIGQSWSRVVIDEDPTGHAEMAAIRDAARCEGDRDLAGTTLYFLSLPCPMCEAPAYWAGISTLVTVPVQLALEHLNCAESSAKLRSL